MESLETVIQGIKFLFKLEKIIPKTHVFLVELNHLKRRNQTINK